MWLDWDGAAREIRRNNGVAPVKGNRSANKPSLNVAASQFRGRHRQASLLVRLVFHCVMAHARCTLDHARWPSFFLWRRQKKDCSESRVLALSFSFSSLSFVHQQHTFLAQVLSSYKSIVHVHTTLCTRPGDSLREDGHCALPNWKVFCNNASIKRDAGLESRLLHSFACIILFFFLAAI